MALFNKKNQGFKVDDKLMLTVLSSIALILLIITLGDYLIKRYDPEASLYNRDDYQIVFLNNNLFYFCKLRDFNTAFIECNDPYYFVRKKEEVADGKKEDKIYVTQPSKEEIYQPEGPIYLMKSNIVYITKIGSKSSVIDYINKQK